MTVQSALSCFQRLMHYPLSRSPKAMNSAGSLPACQRPEHPAG